MEKEESNPDRKRQGRNLDALLEVSKALASEIQLDSLLQVIVRKTTEIMEAERSTLFLYDQARDELWSRTTEKLEVKEIRFPAKSGVAGDVARTRRVANIPDAYADPRFNPQFDKLTGYRTRSILCLPIIGNHGELIGVLQVLNKSDGGVFNTEDEALLAAFAAHAAVALERAKMVESYVEMQRLGETLRLAHDIQMSMLPQEFPAFPGRKGFDIFARIIPAKEVGGDFYDFFFIDDDRLCFLIGDVSGKGVPAALFMAVTKTLAKAIAGSVGSPREILIRLNNELCRNNDSCMFVSVFCGILHIKSGVLMFANGGHNAPLLIQPDRGAVFLQGAEGTVLGAMDGIAFGLETVTLKTGDSLFLYTDGVTEAMDAEERFFAEERLEKAVGDLRDQSPRALIDGVMRKLDEFVLGAPQADDITMMAIRLDP
jgi:sigma-B regulation protein RsbU (phosphoserine phosphatase)